MFAKYAKDFLVFDTQSTGNAIPGNRKTAKATPRALLSKYLSEVALITEPSNMLNFGKREVVYFLLFLNPPTTPAVSTGRSY